MSKNRMINTKFWSDGWIIGLNPLERYLFLYLLTNEHTNICGIYELPVRIIARESGIDDDMVLKMLNKFGEKVTYIDGWISIKNFLKHQKSSGNVKLGIENGMALVPPHIMAMFSKELDTPPCDPQHSPILELKHELELEYSLSLGFDFWNSLNSTSKNGLRNTTIKKVGLLKKARKTTSDMEKVWRKIAPSEDDWKLAVRNYAIEIANRSPDSDYALHRFSLYEFLKQSNGYTKFLNI